jgi:hypothetical protein
MNEWHIFSLSNIELRVSDLSDFTEILPFFFWLKRKNGSEPFMILALYFLCSGTISLYGYLTAEADIHNLHLYHIWAIIQVIFIYLYYKSLWKERNAFWPVLLTFAVYLGASIWVQRTSSLNSFCWTANTVIIIYLGTKHFYRLYHDDTITNPLTRRPDFIVTTGWLIYAAGALFVYLLGPDILSVSAKGFFKSAWLIQSVSNLIKTGACCYAFWVLGSK